MKCVSIITLCFQIIGFLLVFFKWWFGWFFVLAAWYLVISQYCLILRRNTMSLEKITAWTKLINVFFIITLIFGYFQWCTFFSPICDDICILFIYFSFHNWFLDIIHLLIIVILYSCRNFTLNWNQRWIFFQAHNITNHNIFVFLRLQILFHIILGPVIF